MNCKNCKKIIEDNSKFCEHCGAKNKITIIISPEIKDLNTKPLYRLLKIAYLVGFCASVFYVSMKTYEEINPSKTIFDNKKTLITCENGSSSSAKDLPINLNSLSGGIGTTGDALKDPNSGGLVYFNGVVNSAYPVLEFCNPQKINTFKDKREAYRNMQKNYTIDFQYKTQWIKFISYWMGWILLVFIVFEALRQLGYYIFLGKLHHSWLTAKLVKIWK